MARCVIINSSLASAKPQPEVSSVDPRAAANVDEDLDYRIAQRTRSTEGWRLFLTSHPDGPHAQLARKEFDQLVSPETPLAAAAQAPGRPPPDPEILSTAAPPDTPSAGSGASAVISEETCKGEEDRLEHLSNSPTSDGVIRFLIELRCEKLRPQVLHLAERVDDQASQAAARRRSRRRHSRTGCFGACLTAAKNTGERTSEFGAESQNRTRSLLSSRGVQPKRHTNGSKAPNLPQLLLALFGEGPRNSTGARRTRTGGGGR